jgi:biopolymer transport protein TolQ
MPEAQVKSFGVVQLILEAGPVVKIVLLLLVLSSILCWAVVITKYKRLKSIEKENLNFLDVFWHSKSLDEIYEKTEDFRNSPIATVFRSGFKELRKVSASKGTPGGAQEVQNIQRALYRASNTEMASIERNVTWLASTASAAPFIGLFGTVWGIMNSFQGIGSTGSANLAVVAPGIAEALIATAFGLAAAIPAAIFYNYFVSQSKRVGIDMDSFAQDFLNIVQRSMIGTKK